MKYVLVVAALLLAGCSADKPLSAESKRDPLQASTGGFLLMPVSQEVRMGKDIRKEVLKQYRVYDTGGLQAYVERVGQAVVKYADRQDIEYTFTVLDDPMINAFAIPGGDIFVTRGLLTVFENEAQLAAVLGHEAGHQVERHIMKKIRADMAFNFLWAMATEGQQVPLPADILKNLVFQAYGRGDEFKSDALGQRYAYEAGYDASQMDEVFEEFARRDPGKTPQWLRSHPLSTDRMTQANDLWALIRSRPEITPGADPLKTNEDAYREIVFPHTYRNLYPAVEETHRKMYDAYAARDVEGVMTHVSEKYRSQTSGQSARELRESLRGTFDATESITYRLKRRAAYFLSDKVVGVEHEATLELKQKDGSAQTLEVNESDIFALDKGGVWKLISTDPPFQQ